LAVYEYKEYSPQLNIDKTPERGRLEKEATTSLALGLPHAECKISCNRVIIPKIGVDAPIVEADNEEEGLSQGAWRLPYTSTPAQDGNTVIAAHRFRYLPPNNLTFYLLDKIEPGDQVVVLWEEQRIEYKVTDKKVVDDTDVSVLDQTERPVLTLLTCHPLFSSEQRLIVVAEPSRSQ
jgi:sortase A